MLTWRQRLFVSAYLENGGNATAAARKATYRTPEVDASRLLRNAKVRAAIDAGLKGAAMPANEVLARLSEIASDGLASFVNVHESGAWSIDLKRAKKAGKLWMLKKIKPTDEGPEIESYSVLDALDKLAKVHGLYLERQEVTTREAGPRVLKVPEKELHGNTGDQPAAGTADEASGE